MPIPYTCYKSNLLFKMFLRSGKERRGEDRGKQERREEERSILRRGNNGMIVREEDSQEITSE